MEITIQLYKTTKQFPQEEKFGLISQIRRSSVSIPSNIAEGAGRKSQKEFKQFLSIAQGSIFELQTQLILADRIGFLNQGDLNPIISDLEEISKKILAFNNKL